MATDAATAILVPCNVPFPERSPEEIAETGALSTRRLGAKSTILARTKEKRRIQKYAEVAQRVRFATFFQRNVCKGAKNERMELDWLDSISYYKRIWTATADARKAEALKTEATAFPAQHTISVKRTALCRLQSKLRKRREQKDGSKGSI